MLAWDTGCSLKQDPGYEEYLRRRSMAPFAYRFSCVAPAACPSSGPRFTECRSFAPGESQIPAETGLIQHRTCRGENPGDGRPQTVMSGTSAYKGGGITSFEVDNHLRFAEPASLAGPCRRQLMENVTSRLDLVGGFVPKVEDFQVGGMSSRCNKLQYRTNPTNAFVNCAPVPPPSTILQGVFPPGFR